MSTEDQPSLEKTVGDRIKEAREARKWSQAYLAERAHVSENTVLSAEHGSRKTRAEKVRAIMEALEMKAPPEVLYLDLTDLPQETRIFLTLAAQRLKVVEDEVRLRAISNMYPSLLETETNGH